MTEKLEIKIKEFDLSHEYSKFVLHKEQDCIGVYGLGPAYGDLMHRDVVSHYNLDPEKILGGGKYEVYCPVEITLYDGSCEFGNVPQSVARCIADSLKKQAPEKQKNLEVSIRHLWLVDNEEIQSKWAPLGYDN